MTDNRQKYDSLRENYPLFTYESFSFEIKENEIHCSFDFRVGEQFRFCPHMKLSLGKYAIPDLQQTDIEGFVFHIGLIELISYWKAFCSPKILIKPYSLEKPQQDWWKKLYRKGLGEFLYQNGLSPDAENFITFTFPAEAKSAKTLTYKSIPDSDTAIVPIGGGKDSVVTLEMLRKEKKIIPFIINPRGATIACAETAGFTKPEERVILNREIDPLLLALNRQGFLNGHTPFSAMLAFYTLLVALTTNCRHIALSNESSANEPTIPGTDINHQYSKSLEFEEDFRHYVRTWMNDTSHYFSFLRQLTELQIAEQFAQLHDYHFIFRSCNAGSKEDKWCCDCSKCLFAYLILSPFLPDEKMIHIFGEDLLNTPQMLPYFDELTGIAENKPFECVGTIEEVNTAIRMIRDSRKNKLLIRHYEEVFPSQNELH
jgi:hypothetical protein